MLSQNLLIAVAGAVAVNALPNLQARGEAEDIAACASAVQSAYKGMPTAPPALQSFYVTQTATDFCSMTIPASLQPTYSSLQSAASSWFAANSARISSALEKCPDMASLTSDMQLPTCTDAGSSGNTGGSGSGQANDNTSGGSDNNSGNGSDKNAGHRNTGVAGLAVAAAAFIGVVAVVL